MTLKDEILEIYTKYNQAKQDYDRAKTIFLEKQEDYMKHRDIIIHTIFDTRTILSEEAFDEFEKNINPAIHLKRRWSYTDNREQVLVSSIYEQLVHLLFDKVIEPDMLRLYQRGDKNSYLLIWKR